MTMVEFSHGNVHRRDWEHAGKKRSAYEYSFTYYTKDGVTRRARGQATTRAEALEAMEARKAELGREPEPVAAPAITLDEYADKWLINIAPSIEKRTHQSYSGLLKNHIRPPSARYPWLRSHALRSRICWPRSAPLAWLRIQCG